MNSEHALGCSWETDQICTCHHIAALEEEASWVKPEFPGAGSVPDYIHFSTMTAAPYPYMGTFVGSVSPAYYPAEMADIRKSMARAEWEAEKRAEIYAKSDALKEARGEWHWPKKGDLIY